MPTGVRSDPADRETSGKGIGQSFVRGEERSAGGNRESYVDRVIDGPVEGGEGFAQKRRRRKCGDRQLSHFRDGGLRGPERHASLAAAGFPQDIAELGPEEVRDNQSEGSGSVIAEQLERLVRVGLAGRGEEPF